MAKHCAYHESVSCTYVRLTVNTDSFDTQFLSCLHDSASNFTSVSNENLIKDPEIIGLGREAPKQIAPNRHHDRPLVSLSSNNPRLKTELT